MSSCTPAPQQPVPVSFLDLPTPATVGVDLNTSAIVPVTQNVNGVPVTLKATLSEVLVLGGGGSSGGGSLLKIPFSYGDASPRSIASITGTVFTTQIVIVVAFNGLNAAIRVGDAGQSDRLIASSQVDVSFAAEYESNPAYTYSTETSILLTIVPGAGATQGSGFVLLEVI